MKKTHRGRATGAFAIAAAAIGAILATGLFDGSTAVAASGGGGESAALINVEELWRANCASCHGRDGKGQTRAGRRAGAKDFTDHEYQTSFANKDAFKYVKEGMVVDEKELMKPFGAGLSEENGLTDDEIKALIEFVRTFDPDWTGE